MLTISQEALNKLSELLSSQGGENAAIRIAVMGGGTDGPGLGLIVDHPVDTDISLTEGGIPFIIDRSLYEYCGSITIGFRTGNQGSCGGSSGSGFIIEPQNPINF